MTERELKGCKAILLALHDEDGRQVSEVSLHGSVITRISCGVAEFTSWLTLCDQNRWVTIVPSRLNTHVRKININDAGEAALLEM